VEIHRWRREFAALRHLPEALQRLRKLERQLASRTAGSGNQGAEEDT
jgi:hypothetical protein